MQRTLSLHKSFAHLLSTIKAAFEAFFNKIFKIEQTLFNKNKFMLCKTYH